MLPLKGLLVWALTCVIFCSRAFTITYPRFGDIEVPTDGVYLTWSTLPTDNLSVPIFVTLIQNTAEDIHFLESSDNLNMTLENYHFRMPDRTASVYSVKLTQLSDPPVQFVVDKFTISEDWPAESVISTPPSLPSDNSASPSKTVNKTARKEDTISTSSAAENTTVVPTTPTDSRESQTSASPSTTSYNMSQPNDDPRLPRSTKVALAVIASIVGLVFIAGSMFLWRRAHYEKDHLPVIELRRIVDVGPRRANGHTCA